MILGLTGSIASGKSTVADSLVECGAILVSADLLAREVVNPGSPTLAKLVDAFGMEILTAGGHLDREVMAQTVFSDPIARRLLESITHPAIAYLAECRLAELSRSPHDLIIYEAPLLFEAGGEGRVEQVLVVVVDPDGAWALETRRADNYWHNEHWSRDPAYAEPLWWLEGALRLVGFATVPWS